MTRRLITTLALVTTLASALTPAAHAADLSGRLQGVLELTAAPSVPWRVELAPGATATALPLTLTAETDGLELRVALDQQAGHDTTWRIETATVELVEWWPAIRALAGLDEMFAGWRLNGRVSVSGEGKLSADGQPGGRVRLTLEDGRAINDADGIELRGIRADLTCDDLTGFTLADGQTLRIGNLKAAGVEVRDATVRFGRAADGVVRLQELSAKVFGGVVSTEPFSFDPAKPALNARLRFDGLSVPAMTTLVSEAISSAQGRLSGAGTIVWQLEQPVPEQISLTFENPGAASVSLSPQPGLLSAGVPPRFTFLPINLGPFTKLFAPENPAYRPLVAIELGRLPLRIDELKVVFTPRSADGTGRSAWLHLKGSPENNDLIKSVTIDLNVHGSLSEVIALGMDKRLH